MVLAEINPSAFYVVTNAVSLIVTRKLTVPNKTKEQCKQRHKVTSQRTK